MQTKSPKSVFLLFFRGFWAPGPKTTPPNQNFHIVSSRNHQIWLILDNFRPTFLGIGWRPSFYPSPSYNTPKGDKSEVNKSTKKSEIDFLACFGGFLAPGTLKIESGVKFCIDWSGWLIFNLVKKNVFFSKNLR